MQIEEFKKLIRTERQRIIKPYDIVFEQFSKLGIDKLSAKEIQESASTIIEQLRVDTWQSYVPLEEKFTTDMVEKIANADTSNTFNNSVGVQAITSFVSKYPDHLHQLILSNTNSRRSRAGKEFEAMLELLLMGCDIPMDSQGKIEKKVFADKGLGKMVDIVIPSAVQFTIDKFNTVLISAKTTLENDGKRLPKKTIELVQLTCT